MEAKQQKLNVKNEKNLFKVPDKIYELRELYISDIGSYDVKWTFVFKDGKRTKWIDYDHPKFFTYLKYAYEYHRTRKKYEIVIDLDHPDLKKNIEKANEITNFLDKYAIKYLLKWTGNKGFHIHILFDAASEKLFKYMSNFLFEYFDVDNNMKRENQMIRALFSYHSKTGNLCIPIHKSSLVYIEDVFNGKRSYYDLILVKNWHEMNYFNEADTKKLISTFELLLSEKVKNNSIDKEKSLIKKKKQNIEQKSSNGKRSPSLNSSKKHFSNWKYLQSLKEKGVKVERVSDVFNKIKFNSEFTARVWLTNKLLDEGIEPQEIISFYVDFFGWDKDKTKKYVEWIVKKRNQT